MQQEKKRFLFIQPEFHRHYVSFFPNYEPLHGLLLAAVAADLCETVIFDRRFDDDGNLVRVCREFCPDVVGFTTHTAGEIFSVHRLAMIVKQECPEAMTIVGGQHSTLLPEDLFSDDVDLICIGPGEHTFREVVMALDERDFTGIPGLAVRINGEYHLTPPRTIRSGTFSWPIVDRRCLPEKYRKHYYFRYERKPNVYTITTSGCPHRCKFCSLWATVRGTYRRRTPEEIVEDIASQPQPYVHLTDDNTFDNEAQAAEICRLLKARGIKKKIMAYARADSVIKKFDLIKQWREAGLGAVVVGMEAVSDKHLAYLNKRSSLDLNIQAHQALEQLKIENWAHFVIMPQFTADDFDAIWEFVERWNMTYPIFVPMTPVPGTPLFFEEKDAGRITTFDYGFYNLQYMVVKTLLPKAEWYSRFIDLYRKSCSLRTLLRRARHSPSFHWRPACGRAIVFQRAMRELPRHIAEQLRHEESFRYAEMEHSLPPSLRTDYRADNYYNAVSLQEVEKRWSDDNTQQSAHLAIP